MTPKPNPVLPQDWLHGLFHLRVLHPAHVGKGRASVRRASSKPYLRWCPSTSHQGKQEQPCIIRESILKNKNKKKTSMDFRHQSTESQHCVDVATFVVTHSSKIQVVERNSRDYKHGALTFSNRTSTSQLLENDANSPVNAKTISSDYLQRLPPASLQSPSVAFTIGTTKHYEL